MLIGNGVRTNQNPMRQMMAPLAGAVQRTESMQTGAKRNWWTAPGADRRSGVPDGLRPPKTWLMAPTTGGMSARNQLTITVTPGALVLAGGRNIDGTAPITLTVPTATLVGLGLILGTTPVTVTVPTSTITGAVYGVGTSGVTFTVPASAISASVSIEGATTLTITVSDAVLSAAKYTAGTAAITFAVADANLAGAAYSTGTSTLSLALANANLVGARYGSGSTAITFSLDVPTLGAVADLIGVGAISFSGTGTPRAIGYLEGTTDEQAASTLTADAVATAVWGWIVEAGYTSEEILRLLSAATVGASSGAPDGPIVFTGLDGTTARVSGAVDGDGNRSSVVLDPG
jgi:hypothetical protein